MLSVLIVSWNTKELLRACLASIVKNPPSIPYEVIVVDNASTDESAEMVRAEFPSVRLIQSESNQGYAAGNNLAFNAATGSLLLTLNPDTEVYHSTFDGAIEALGEHPRCGYLGVRQIDAKSGGTQHSVRGFPSFRGILGALTGLGKRFGGAWDSYLLTRFDYERAQPAPQPMGTFLLLRREALENVGDASAPFDPAFPIFFNEVDLLYRLNRAAWTGWYAPQCHILHHGGESTKQVKKSMIWESHKSLVRYFRKHHGTGFGWVGLPFLTALVYAAAFVRAKGYHAGFRA